MCSILKSPDLLVLDIVSSLHGETTKSQDLSFTKCKDLSEAFVFGYVLLALKEDLLTLVAQREINLLQNIHSQLYGIGVFNAYKIGF